MTVEQLIALLCSCPAGARVYEERESELRELRPSDFKLMLDRPIAETADGEEIPEDPLVVLGAWS